MRFTPKHEQLRKTVAKFVETELNPHVDAWEAVEQFPAQEVVRTNSDRSP
jgi:citronellyl-CoA dehydrogenase